MSAPDHWQSLSKEKRLEMEKHARGLVRGSIIEDAASRFMAMCMAEAIGESKRRTDPSDPMQDERVKRLVEALINEAVSMADDNDEKVYVEKRLRTALRDLGEG